MSAQAHEPLSDRELALIKRLFGRPELIPDDFWSYGMGFIEKENLLLPYSQLVGAPQVLSYATTWNPGSVADAAMTSTTVAAPEARLGDLAIVSFSVAVTAGAFMVAHVTAADVVTVTLFNKTGGNLDLAEGTLRVGVFRPRS